MALLKDTVISGSLRATDTIYTTTLQAQIINAPTASNGTTYGPGTNGYVLKSNGSSVYWSSLGSAAGYSITDSSSASAIGTGTALVTERDVYYGLPTINNAHNYTSSTTIYAPTAGGTANYVLMGNGTTAAPIWKTPKDALNIMINALDTGSSALTANDYVITQYVGGGTTTTTYHRRPASAMRVGGLLTARKLKVALGSTADATFDGTADQTSIPVSGTLGIAHGGTGATTAAGIREALGLSNAMHFIGKATTTITDGGDEDPGITDYSPAPGDVVISSDDHREYVWSAADKWEMLGFDASQQFSETTTGNTFISSVTQNTDGTVSASSRALDTSVDWTGNAGSATRLKTARYLAVALGSTAAVSFNGTANCTTIPVNGVLDVHHGGTGTNSFVSGNLLVGNGQGALTTIAKTSANTANTVVERDASGNFSANTITASKITSNDTLIIQTTGTEKALTLKSNYTIFIDRGDNTSIVFRKNGTENARFNSAGNFVPGTTNTLGLGTDSLRWKNVYATNIYGTVDHATTTLDNTSVLHPVGITSSATSTLKYDDSIAMTGGQINAEKFRINDQAFFEYNSTDDTIDLIWG